MIKKINLNRFEKLIEDFDKNKEIKLEKEYNIDMGNSSYFKVITNKKSEGWIIFKINKKSKIKIEENLTPKNTFKKLLNIAINI